MRKDTLTTWHELYKNANENERAKMNIVMQWTIHRQERDEIELYKTNPLILDGLSLPRLRTIASIAYEDLSQWLYDQFPDLRDKLNALNCLGDFVGSGNQDITFRDIRAVIDSICAAWDVSQCSKSGVGKYDKP